MMLLWWILLQALACGRTPADVSVSSARAQAPPAPTPSPGHAAPWEGLFHTCVVRPTGRVWCWGANHDGELADGSREDRFVPVVARAPADVVQVAAGLGQTCAVRRGGTVLCWGGPERGGPVAGVQQAVQVSAGGGYACAVLRGGAVRCWGTVCGPCPAGRTVTEAQMGACGTPVRCALATRRGPADVVGIDDAVQVSVGSSLDGNEYAGSWSTWRPCAVLADGGLACWAPADARARRVSGLPPLRQVATRGEYTVVLTRDGRVLHWRGDRGAPVPVPGLDGALSIAAGWSQACAARRDGSVWCWRADASGTPARIGHLDHAVSVMCGAHHACARTGDGEVRCWGSRDRGFMGVPAVGLQPSPVPITLPAPAVEIEAGNRYTCARLRDGTVACWGHDYAGLLGRGAGGTHPQSYPDARRVARVRGARELAVGDHHACVVRAGDRLTCWGTNHTGPFGAPPYEMELGATDAATLPGLELIAAGAHRTCVALASGEVRCAGDDDGQFTRVGELSGRAPPVQLAAGSGTACTRAADLSVRCAGALAEVTLRDVLFLAARSTRVCGVTERGEVRCARLALDGPSGQAVVRTEPLGLVAEAIEVGVGEEHDCVRTRRGEVVCRGQGESGELGNGAFESHTDYVPVPVAGIAQLAVGDHHTCARDGAGAVWCWGSNLDHQIGVAEAEGPQLVRFAE